MNSSRMILGASASIALIAALGQTCEPKATIPQALDQRIDSIHKGFQNALEDLSMTKLRTIKFTNIDGKIGTIKAQASFGFNRTTPYYIPHNDVLRNTGVDRTNFSTLNVIDIYGASCSGKPLRPGKLQVNDRIWMESVYTQPAHEKWATAIANKAVNELRSKDVIRGISAGRLYEARPLRLTDEKCLPCHSGSKIGDPMAIMVYEIMDSKPKSSFGGR